MAQQPVDRDIPLSDTPAIRLAYAKWMQKGAGGLAQLTSAYPPDQVLDPAQLDAFRKLHAALDVAVQVFHPVVANRRAPSP
jgi:hypothetical protein